MRLRAARSTAEDFRPVEIGRGRKIFLRAQPGAPTRASWPRLSKRLADDLAGLALQQQRGAVSEPEKLQLRRPLSTTSIIEAQGVCHFSRIGWRRRAAKLFSASASACASASRGASPSFRCAISRRAPNCAIQAASLGPGIRPSPSGVAPSSTRAACFAMRKGIFIRLGRIARQRQGIQQRQNSWNGLDARFSDCSARAASSSGKSFSIHQASTAARTLPTSGPSGTPAAITSRPVSGKRGRSQLSATDSSMRQGMALAPGAAAAQLSRTRSREARPRRFDRAGLRTSPPTNAAACCPPPPPALPAGRGRRRTSFQPLATGPRHAGVVRQQRRQPQNRVGRKEIVRIDLHQMFQPRHLQRKGQQFRQNARRRHHPQHRRGIGTFQQPQQFLGDAFAGQLFQARLGIGGGAQAPPHPSRPCRTRRETGTGAGCAWCSFEDFGDVEQVELDPAFMCDCRQMQRGIGRTA